MREIKFRAWDIKNKEMVHDFIRYAATAAANAFEFQSFYYNAFEDGRFVPEQSTGLHDKNGREIYEGDILHCGIHPMYIEWNEEFGQWYASDMDNAYHTPLWICLHGNNAVLTGNIHENPELLEANK